MTKLRALKAKPELTIKPTDLNKTRAEIIAQRLAVLAMSRKAAEKSVIVMPDGSTKEGDPLTSMFFFGMANGLAWVLGEENVPPHKWEMPKE